MSHHEPTGFEDLEPENEKKPSEKTGKPTPLERFDDEEFPSWSFEDDLDDVDFSKLADDFDDLADDFDDLEDELGDDFDFEDDFDYETESAFDDIYRSRSRTARKLGNLAEQAARAAYIGCSHASGLPTARPNEAATELMQTLAAAAASSKSQSEAERLIASIVPLSLLTGTRDQRAIWPALPALIQGAAGVARFLHRRADTRLLIKTMPVILNEAAKQLARHVARGQPVTHRLAARVLSRQTATHLRRQRYQTVRRSNWPSRIQRGYTNDGDWWDDNGHGA